MNIFLIGYRGSGKTAAGRELAERLELAFLDLDEEIEKFAGKSIAEVFDKEGEHTFREMEKKVLAETAARRGQVVATGGGIVLLDANVDVMRDHGAIVHLDCEASVAADRIEADPRTESIRPKLSDANLRSEVRMHMRIRGPQYRAAADITIDTSRASPDEAAEEIIGKLVSEGGLELETEPKYSIKNFAEMLKINPVRLPKNTRIQTEGNGLIYKANPASFCDSCASSSSVLVRLEGTNRLRCVQCGEWIKVERVGGSDYEFYLPRKWKDDERKKWYKTWKLRRSVHIETRRMIKDYLGALKLPEDDEEEPAGVEDYGEDAGAERTLSPELAAYYVRVLEGEDPPEPARYSPAASRTSTGTEIVDLTPAQPFDPAGIGAHAAAHGRQDGTEIVDLTPAQPFDPASIGVPPAQAGRSDGSEIIDLTPAQPFDPALITAPPPPQGQSGGSEIIELTPAQPFDPATIGAPREDAPPRREEKPISKGKSKTRIVWGQTPSSPAQPEMQESAPQQREKSPEARPGQPGKKRAGPKTRITFSDQAQEGQQADDGRQSPFEKFDQDQKKKPPQPPPR